MSKLKKIHHPGDGSTGPRTPEGKERSSRNGLVHGMRSEKHVILPGESQTQFNKLHAQWLFECDPESDLEREMIELVVKRHWHFLRCERMFDEAQETLLLNKPTLSTWTEEDHRALQLATRYRNTAERAYKSARADLDNLRQGRLAEDRLMKRFKRAVAKIKRSDDYPECLFTDDDAPDSDQDETEEAMEDDSSERSSEE